MKKLMLIALMLLLLIPQSVLAAPQDITGTGTPADPYIIYTAAGLDQVRNDLDAHYKLGADIDLSGYSNWDPIGDDTVRFVGTFDGDGHIITNLTINRPTEVFVGFFGSVGVGAILEEIALTNIYVEGELSVGGLIGDNSGIVRDSYTSGFVKANGVGFDAGGLIGMNSGIIVRSFSTCNVEGEMNIGGLVGSNFGSVSNSYTIGNVTGDDSIGGFVGLNGGSIENSYASGLVLSNGVSVAVGGLVGDGTSITHSYYSESTGQTDTGKGIRLTDDQMKRQASFIGWDFTNIWTIEEGNSYPTLIALTAVPSGDAFDLVTGLNNYSSNVLIDSNRPVQDFDVSNALPYGYATLAAEQ